MYKRKQESNGSCVKPLISSAAHFHRVMCFHNTHMDHAENCLEKNSCSVLARSTGFRYTFTIFTRQEQWTMPEIPTLSTASNNQRQTDSHNRDVCEIIQPKPRFQLWARLLGLVTCTALKRGDISLRHSICLLYVVKNLLGLCDTIIWHWGCVTPSQGSEYIPPKKSGSNGTLSASMTN